VSFRADDPVRLRKLSAVEKLKLGVGSGGGTGAQGAPGPPLADGDYGDIVVSGAGTAINLDATVVTAAAKTVLDDANVAAMRATLGVDAAGTDNSTNVTLGGTPTYITIAGQVITRGKVDLTNSVTGDLPLANLAPASAEKKLLGRGAGVAGDFEEIALGANLTMTGTTLAAAAPAHAIVSATHSDMDVSAALAQGSVLVGTSFPAWKALTPVTANHVLKFNGTDTVWGTTPTVTHDLLSATHSDTTASAATAGALIVGASGAGGWAKLTAPGTSFNFLTFDGTDTTWGPLASSEFTVYNAAVTAYSRWRRAAGGVSHDLVLPNAQGAASTFLKNDGAGNLTWDAPAAGGAGNSVTVTVDFGSSFSHFATVAVTGQAWVAAGSEIVATVLSATGKGMEDAVLSFSASVSSLVAATGFTLNVYTPVKAKGTYTFSCIGV